MTTGGFIRLIFLKDVCRYMRPLGIVLGMGPLIALTLFWAGAMPTAYVIPLPLLAYLLGIFITMDVIQIDSPARELRFLSTRPVPGEAIFLAKVLFLGLFLILGGWGSQEVGYAVLGMPLQPLDHLCLLIETTIRFGTPIALIALFTIFLRKNTYVLFALGLFLMAILLLACFSMIFPGVASATPDLNHAQLCWSALVGLLGLWGFIGVAMLAAVVRYRTHNFALPLALVIGGIILDLIICVGAATIGESRLAHDQAGNIPAHLRDQIRLTNYSFSQQTEQMAWNLGIVYHTVVRGPNVEGIEPPYYFRVVGSQSSFAPVKSFIPLLSKPQYSPRRTSGI
jgi:hypothetical protein